MRRFSPAGEQRDPDTAMDILRLRQERNALLQVNQASPWERWRNIAIALIDVGP
jgi:hypothetical protein